MKTRQVLSIAAAVSAILFIITGIAVLVLQRYYLAYYMSPSQLQSGYYPISVTCQLLFTGLPCLMLGFMSLYVKDEDEGNWSLYVMIYCSVILISSSWVNGFLNTLHNTVLSAGKGSYYLTGLSIVSSVFARTRIFANASLVCLLIASVMQYTMRKKSAGT